MSVSSHTRPIQRQHVPLPETLINITMLCYKKHCLWTLRKTHECDVSYRVRLVGFRISPRILTIGANIKRSQPARFVEVAGWIEIIHVRSLQNGVQLRMRRKL